MSTPQKQTAKPKKFQVFVGTELQSESNIHADVMVKVQELKDKNVPEIKLVNHVYKNVHLYTKGNSEKNYRIVDALYVLPAVE